MNPENPDPVHYRSVKDDHYERTVKADLATATCRACGEPIHLYKNGRGPWVHVQGDEMFCEPNPREFRMAAPVEGSDA